MRNAVVLANNRGVSVWHGRSSPADSVKEAMIDTDEAVNEYAKYCKNVKKSFDSRMKHHGLKLTLHIEAALERLRKESLRRSDSYINSALNLFKTGVRSGQVSHEQVYTAVDVIASGLKHKAINILGPCQGGKTGTMTMLFFMEPLCHNLLTNVKTRPILSLVNQQSLDAQIRQEFQNFVNLHVYFGVRNSKEEFIQEYFDKLGYDLNTHDWTDAVIRNSVAKIGDFRRVLQECKNRNLVPIISIDEIHNGSAMDSVLDRWCGELLAATKEADFDQCHFRFISATPFETIHIPNVKCIEHWIGPDYMGWPYFLNHRFPTTNGYEVRLPEVHKYRDIFGCIELCRESYKNICVWLKRQQGILDREDIDRLAEDRSRIKRWKDYQKNFIFTLAGIINRLLHDDCYGLRRRLYKDHKGHMKRACGMCIRVASKNVSADDIADDLEKSLPRTTAVLRGYGSHMKAGQSIQQMIDEQVFGGGYDSYVILVTGGARMGVYFPPTCTFFMDLTREAGNATSFLQGLIGRALGYGKDSVLFLSNSSYDDVHEYISTEGTSSKRPGSRSEFVEALPGRPSINIDILRKDIEGIPEFRPLVEAFEKIDEIFNKEILANGKVACKGSRENSKDIWKVLKGIHEFIEANPSCVYSAKDTGQFRNIKLLRFDYNTLDMANEELKKHWKKLIAQKESEFVSEHPESGSRPERRSVYNCVIGRRRYTASDLEKVLSGTARNRNTRRTATGNVIEPQIHIVKDGPEKNKCAGITFPLRFPAKRTGQIVRPTDKSALSKML